MAGPWQVIRHHHHFRHLRRHPVRVMPGLDRAKLALQHRGQGLGVSVFHWVPGLEVISDTTAPVGCSKDICCQRLCSPTLLVPQEWRMQNWQAPAANPPACTRPSWLYQLASRHGCVRAATG